MARLESQALAGYYPLPTQLTARIAALVDFDAAPGKQYVLFDPCAGDGAAIFDLASEWFSHPSRMRIVACEMERSRADTLIQATRRAARGSGVPEHHLAIHADAFRLTWSAKKRGASLLYLNPPYDHDHRHGRLEQRFLVRFTQALAVGGALVFVVPQRSLRASASYLARYYQDLRCYRFPDDAYDAYRQVVLVGRRAQHPGTVTSDQVDAWATAGRDLPELPEAGAGDPLAVRWGSGYELHIHKADLDLRAALDAARVWEGGDTGTDLGLGDLIGRQYPTALPPKAAHLALAVAAGHFNGHRLAPNPGLEGEWPPILIKGIFTRDRKTVQQKENASGQVVSEVQVETPKLRMSGLRLDTFAFFAPAPGSDPSEPDHLGEANTADIIVNYGNALAKLMAQQFPALHVPGEDEVRLPDLPRQPYLAQRDAINAAIKLLGAGRNPIFVSEVGTGKTTMSAIIMASLHHRHHARTQASLRAVPRFADARLPKVGRTLVLCPPHLFTSWKREMLATWPSARVVLVKKIPDLYREGDVFVLTRESAKLGSGRDGVGGCSAGALPGPGPGEDPRSLEALRLRERNFSRDHQPRTCPACGATIDPDRADPKDLARKRDRCGHEWTRPANFAAEVAEDLAPFILHVDPTNELAGALVSDRRILRATTSTGNGSGKLDRGAVLRICQRLISEMLRAEGSYGRDVVTALTRLARCCGEPKVLRSRIVQELEGREGANDTPAYDLKEVLTTLPETTARGEQAAITALAGLYEAAEWEEWICDEPLWQMAPRPRRYPLANYILRHLRDRFDLLVLDEFHEYCNLGTAQQKAAHRLAEHYPTLALSGSVMGGYASSLFINWWTLSRTFRQAFDREDANTFVARFGYRKVKVTTKRREGPDSYGASSDREIVTKSERILGETPGVAPLFILTHILPEGVVLHKDDLGRDLEPMLETPVALKPDPEEEHDEQLLEAYRTAERALMAQIQEDQFTELAGKLWGMMTEMPSYLDRATEDHGGFEVRYPESVGGQLVVAGETFPETYRTPKERWLVEAVRAEIQEGRKVLIFLRHTRGPLPGRLAKLLQEDAGIKPVFLDAGKVGAAGREDWIREEVLATGTDVLLVNPRAVSTGLNCLVAFSTGIWYEATYDARTFRQANGRLHRLGQELQVRIYWPFYAETSQEAAHDLVAKKVTSSLQVDGLSVIGALEAAGAGDDAPESLELALRVGEAIYRRMRRRLTPAA